ncbi:TonB-dependent receptor [Massilia sp. NR 4-1]|uniref:TonB-dependent receptor n=1 Tax=Massilia sp. NR 4-1 TaxID=1678028 RepID=UPI0009E327A5|nr:TonB-dependent receptor [Massilia sp. NR 4-1]
MKSTLRPMAGAIALVCASGWLSPAHAGADEAPAMSTVTISGERAAGYTPLGSAARTQEELRQQQNIFNPEDALRNLPGMTLRKRYSGDRNALIGGRSFATSQAPRALVYMDGYLLSNLIGRFDAPRWNMLAPEEISSVEALYGPFSALYPGNSIGTTIAIGTSRPEKFTGAARVAGQVQEYGNYGLKDRYRNYQASLLLGDRLASGLWYKLMANHQDSTSQPMQYYGITASDSGTFTPPQGSARVTPVSGIVYDTAPTGQRRAIFGPNAGAIDHTRQNTLKLTMGYDFTPELSADGFLAWWSNDTATRNQSFLRDAAGNTVWSGRVSQDSNVFQIAPNVFAPYIREERHMQGGLALKTRYRAGWNTALSVSRYAIEHDTQRNAALPDPQAASGGAGSAVLRNGSGFRTLELRSSYTPTPGDWTGGLHALTVGLHASDYVLKQTTRTLADWRSANGEESQFVGGKTRLLAIYGQDVWRFAPQWRATAGLRAETWKSFDGVQRFRPGPTENYRERSEHAFSPKLSLGWDAAPGLDLQLSAGRGTRFATVSELFQGSLAGSSLTVADPNLKPERSTALEFSAEQRFDAGKLRAAVFQDDVRNTIWSQLNLSVFPVVTSTQNVGQVRTRGLELAGVVDDLGLRGLSLDANISYSKAIILENANYQPSVGKRWARIPHVRSTTTLLYAPQESWSLAATWRYSGRQFSEINNSDINPDVYGGLSRQKQLDLRLLLKPAARTEIAIGVDNLNNYLAWQSHPFPGRTLFAEVRYAF